MLGFIKLIERENFNNLHINYCYDIFKEFRLIQKLVKGFEPPTYGLQIRCSTVELHQHTNMSVIPLVYLLFNIKIL